MALAWQRRYCGRLAWGDAIGLHQGEPTSEASWLQSQEEHQDQGCCLCLGGSSASLSHFPRKDLIFPTLIGAG